MGQRIVNQEHIHIENIQAEQRIAQAKLDNVAEENALLKLNISELERKEADESVQAQQRISELDKRVA